MRKRLEAAAGSIALLVLLSGCGSTHPHSQKPPLLGPTGSIPLASGWRYLSDPGNIGFRDRWGQGSAPVSGWTPVSIPNDFNPQVQPGADQGRVGWYEVRFTAPRELPGQTWAIHFESVRRDAAVWLNGAPIGTNTDPYAPFTLPASSLVPGHQNTLVVRVDNIKGPGSFPEDWWNWGGILGPVTLQPVGRLKLTDLGVMPELGCDYTCGDLLVQGTLTNVIRAPLHAEIAVQATSPTGKTSSGTQLLGSLAPGTSVPVSFRVPVRGPLNLWSPSDPALYSVSVSTLGDGHLEQADSLQVGMRSVQVSGGIIYLNGQRLWLHGAAIHEDAEGEGAALSDGDIDTIVSELRSLNANITRAHYLLSPRLLDALDQAGIMVWSQPPVGHADQQLETAGGRSRALQMLRDTIIGERSHPSVIVDSVGNELSPTPDTTPGTRAYLDQAIPMARQLDPVAPVGLDIYCYPNFPAQATYRQLDVLGISSYFGWYEGPPGHSIADFSEMQPYMATAHARYPQQALVVSEFGAEGLFDGPATVKGTYEFQSNYLQRTAAALNKLPFANGMIYWTLREFAEGPGWVGGADLPPGYPTDGIHHKGLIAYDDTAKPAFSLASQLFADPPGFVEATPPLRR